MRHRVQSRRAWLSVALLLGVAVPVSGTAETLEDAWRLALEHNSALAAAMDETAAAQASERAMRATRWPALSTSGGYTRFSSAPQLDIAAPGLALRTPLISGDDYGSANLQLALPLFTAGRLPANILAAHYDVITASETEHAARATLRLAVAESYIAVLRAKHQQTAAESSVASLGAHVSDVQSMVERELVATSDLLAARVALANAEQQRVRAHNAVALASAAYNRYLGEPLDRVPELDETLPMDAHLAAESLDSLLKRAVSSRGEVAAMSARADALVQRATAERASALPQVALNAGYTYMENAILDRKDFGSIGISVSWTLFDAGSARNRSAALRSASRAVQRRTDDIRSMIELEVREAWLNVREARARIMATAEAVSEAEENLRMARELYRTGLGTNTQVLDAVTLQVAAINNADDAKLDESLALLRLAHAAGNPADASTPGNPPPP